MDDTDDDDDHDYDTVWCETCGVAVSIESSVILRVPGRTEYGAIVLLVCPDCYRRHQPDEVAGPADWKREGF